MLDPHYLGGLINQYSIAHGLRADVVGAMVIQESGGNPLATRFEEHIFMALDKKRRNELAGYVPPSLPTLRTEKVLRSCSHGLLQVLGETARWCAKFKGDWLNALQDPELGMDVGCQVLKYYLGRNRGIYERGIAAFNAGDPDSPQGQHYAKEVLTRVAKKEYLRFYP